MHRSIALIILGYIAILLPYINAPALHRYEQTDIPQYLGTAIKHAEMGLSRTFGRDYKADGTTRYLNHPGLLSVVLSVPVALVGPSNALARALPVLFNVTSIAVLAALVVHARLNIRLFALLLFTTPLTVLYGRDLVIYAPVLLFSLLCMITYLYGPSHFKQRTVNALVGLFAFIASSFDWAGYLIYPLIFSWELEKAKRFPLFLVLIAACAASLGIFLWQNYAITGSAFEPLQSAFSQSDFYKERITTVYNEAYTIRTWFMSQALYMVTGYGVAALLATLGGMYISLRAYVKSKQLPFIEHVAWGSLGLGLAFLFLTVPWSYVHAYTQLLLLPAFLLFPLILFRALPNKHLPYIVLLYVLLDLPLYVQQVLHFYSIYA